MNFFILKKNKEQEQIKLPTNIFNINYNEKLIHQLISTYIYNSHTGIKKHKSRSEVSGGGKKPWKQKGTGRARAGTIRSPLWKGGGKTFAFKGVKKPEKKINKKVYKLGIKIILSKLFKDNKIIFIDDFKLTDNKTKTFLNEISFIEKKNNILIILDNIEKNLYLASRNVKNIFIINYKKINPFLLMKFNSILINKSSIKYIEEYFK